MEKALEIFYEGLSSRLQSVLEVKQIFNPEIAFDFNSFNFFNLSENTFSKIIRYLLDPEEGHGQGREFLTSFLELISPRINKDDLTLLEFNPTCSCEHLAGSRRIDILIEFGKEDFGIAIENKIGADDQPNQLNDYAKYLELKFQGKFHLIYLTPFGDEPSTISIQKNIWEKLILDGKVSCMSYQHEIINCLDSWRKISQSEKVRYFLSDFKKCLKEKVLKEKFMNEQSLIADFVLKNEGYLRTSFAVEESMLEIKKRLINSFKHQIDALARSLDMKSYYFDDLAIEKNSGFYFKKDSWRYYCLNFQFGGKNGISFFSSVALIDHQIKHPDTDFLKKLNQIVPLNHQENVGYPQWQYFEPYNWDVEVFLDIQKGGGKLLKNIEIYLKKTLLQLGDFDL